jgi:hypothetical protein
MPYGSIFGYTNPIVGMGEGYFAYMRYQDPGNRKVEMRRRTNLSTIVDSYTFSMTDYYPQVSLYNGYGDFYVLICTTGPASGRIWDLFRIIRTVDEISATSVGTITLTASSVLAEAFITADGSQIAVLDTQNVLTAFSTVDASVVYQPVLNSYVTNGWNPPYVTRILGILSSDRFVVWNNSPTVRGFELYRGTDGALLSTLPDEFIAGGRFDDYENQSFWVPSGDGLAYALEIPPVGNSGKIRVQVDVLTAIANVLEWANPAPHNVSTKWASDTRFRAVNPTEGRLGLLGAGYGPPDLAFYVIDPYTGDRTRSVRDPLLSEQGVSDIAFVTETKAVVTVTVVD